MELGRLRDKAVEGMRRCMDSDCQRCPYWDEDCDGGEKVLLDALAVMEAMEPGEPGGPDCHVGPDGASSQ